MKRIINLKHWQTVLFSLTFVTSFIVSKKYTDPFFVPKNFFFFFSAGVFFIFLSLFYYFKKYKTRVNFTQTDLSVFLLLLYFSIRVLFTPGINLGNTKNFLFLVCGFLYFFIKPFLFKKEKELKAYQVQTVVNILLLIAIVQVLWGLSQYFNFTPNLQKEFRIGGAFGNPGQYTNFLTPVLSFSLATTLFSKNKNKALGIIATTGIILILPFTQARTAWIATLCIILYLIDKKYSVLKKLAGFFKTLTVKILILILVIAGVTWTGNFMYNLKKDSASGRLFLWKVSIEMIKDNPLFGQGFDRYAAVHNDYQAEYFKADPDDLKNANIADGVNYAFNEFIQIAAETGLTGLVLLLFIFRCGMISKKEVDSGTEEDYIFYAAKGSIIAIFISSLFSYPLHTIPSLILLFFSLAVTDAFSNKYILSFSFEKKTRKIISVTCILLVLAYLMMQYKRDRAEREWLFAYKYMRENRYDEAYRLYRRLYPVLKYNQFFLFNYGAELTLMKKYDESIKILKETELRLNDTDFYIYLGDSYENKGNFAEAEKCYRKAMHIIPSKFYPKYRLVKLYLKTGRQPEAVNLAKEILNMKIKVQSEIVDTIIREMAQLVNSASPVINKSNE